VERIGDASEKTKAPTTGSCGMYPLIEGPAASRVVLCSYILGDRRRGFAV